MASNSVSNGGPQFQTGLVPLFVNGKEVTTSTTFTVRNPSTGKDLWQSSSSSVDDAIKAVEAAQAAFPAWSKAKPAVRRDILLRAADVFEKRKEELGHYMKIETGAVDQFVDFIITITIDQLKDVAGRISAIQGFVPTLSEEGASAIVYKEPYGVILGIAPWYSKSSLLRQSQLIPSGMPHTPLGFEPSPTHLRRVTPPSSKAPNSVHEPTGPSQTASVKLVSPKDV
jgi:hypothetical protein